MKISRIFALTLTTGALTWSCQQGPSETEKAYEEMVSQTDSIQMMASNMRDTLQTVMNANQDLMASMDTATQDSSNIATLSRNAVIFEEQQASLNKINEMVANFESFESEYGKGEMNEEDVKAKVDEIKSQQNEIFEQLDNVENELARIRDDQQNMMDRRNNDPMTDGEQMDIQAAAAKN